MKIKNIIFILLILFLIISFTYYFFQKKDRDISNEMENNTENTNEEKEEVKEETKEPEIVYREYDEDNAYDGATYFEKIVNIKTQNTYYSHPLKVQEDTSVRLIVYSHGSNTVVSSTFNTDFMKDLQAYGDFFSSRGYAFIASNQYGANYGNANSIQATQDAIEYMKEKYNIEDKVYHIGFSMGGLPAILHTMKYRAQVEKLALLAPVTYSTSWSNQNKMKDLAGIDIMIWHGNKDVNVPYSASVDFINDSKRFKLSAELVTLENKTHWDVDTELMEEILQFYEK